jgi:TolA-binding protein
MTSREVYIKKLQEQLDEWESKIKVLKTDAQRMENKTSIEFEKRIMHLQQKCEAAKRRIEQIKNSENAGWEELKEGAEQMWDGIKDLFKNTKTEFYKGLKEGEKS